jgi:hypothetical protein
LLIVIHGLEHAAKIARELLEIQAPRFDTHLRSQYARIA